MNEIVPTSSVRRVPAPLPEPRERVVVRPGTAGDVPFIDRLQKTHSKMVGFMPAKQLEGKIAAGHVLVAEGDAGAPVGYVIGQDRYFKHDDVGIIYQLNVGPGSQRGFVGAMLLRAMFDRAAYGCKLFCCWCAQDIEANRFWEAMGFAPLAFRAGSEKKSRVHIFWQKRIRPGDNETPWWFPAKTDAGAMREDRLVLPIPPGLRWWDEMPVLWTEPAAKALPDQGGKPRGGRVVGDKCGPQAPTPPPRAKVQFAAPGAKKPVVAAEPEKPAEKPAKARREKRKADPKLVAMARELRDRWLEQVNSGGAGAYVFEDAGKYDVTRALPAGPGTAAKPMPLLPAA